MGEFPKPLIVETTEVDREEFLATFSREEEKKIRCKVDKRFFLLIGLMYMVKQVCVFPAYAQKLSTGGILKANEIDVNDVSSIKILQEGQQPSNNLNELHMSPNQYNWVSSIYTVGLSLPRGCLF
jgi:hypothetical protein